MGSQPAFSATAEPTAITVRGVLRETSALYRRLFTRSVTVAAAVFLVFDLFEALAVSTDEADGGLGLYALLSGLSFVFFFTGSLLVQGALAEAVRDVHGGRRPEGVGALYRRLRPQLWTLVVASVVVGVAVGVGLVLLIVPGLVLMTRWSLVVPLIVFEKRSVGGAFRRSAELVRGNGWRVFWTLLVAYLGLAGVGVVINAVFMSLPAFYGTWLGALAATASRRLTRPIWSQSSTTA